MPKRVLTVALVTKQGPISVLFGVVEGRPIATGDSVFAVDAAGQRDPAMIVGVMPNQAGLKDFDRALPGKSVKVVVRRASPTFADDDIVALEIGK